jgi:hypothetical protein
MIEVKRSYTRRSLFLDAALNGRATNECPYGVSLTALSKECWWLQLVRMNAAPCNLPKCPT